MRCPRPIAARALDGAIRTKNGEEKSSPLTLFAVTPLTRFAFRNPRGANYACAARDLLRLTSKVWGAINKDLI